MTIFHPDATVIDTNKRYPYENSMQSPPVNLRENILSLVARISRYLTRLLLRPKIVRIDGVTLSIPNGVRGSVLHSLYAERYERLERALLPLLLRSDDRIVELGSAIGYIGLVTSRIVGSSSIIMVEANADLIPEIVKNFSLNNVALPSLRHGVASTSNGMIEFHVDAQFWASSTRPVPGSTSRVDHVEMIDTNYLLREHCTTVLICDIEGGEIDLLPALDLTGIRLVVAELHPAVIGNTGVDKILSHMKTVGLPVRHILANEVYIFSA